MNSKTDIYSLLKTDHENVKSMFEKLEGTSSRSKKAREQIFSEIKTELSAHAKAEKTAFYDRLQKEKDAKDEILEANEEHQVVTQLLEDIAATSVDDERWMAKCTVLKEIVLHHVKEEEGEIFKTAKQVFDKNDALEIGAEFLELKEQIKSQENQAPVRTAKKSDQSEIEASA